MTNEFKAVFWFLMMCLFLLPCFILFVPTLGHSLKVLKYLDNKLDEQTGSGGDII